MDKFKLLMLVTIIFICNVFNTDIYSKKFLDKIIYNVNGNLEECGMNIAFSSNEYLKNEIQEIIFDNFTNLTLKVEEEKENFICIFNNENLEIKAQSYFFKGEYNYNIFVKTNKYEENFKSITALNSIFEKRYECKEDIYVKMKLKNNIPNDNRIIMKCFEKLNVLLVDTIKVSNGYSNMMYFVSLKDGVDIKELNYAVCSYQSGDYLYIGIPQIQISY